MIRREPKTGNMVSVRHTTLIGALLALIWLAPAPTPGAVHPVNWVVAAEKSQILFEYLRNGAPAQGRFITFSGEGRFDQAEPEAATLELRIESSSIDLGDPLESAFATSVEWFDAAHHPRVVYRLLALSPEGEGRYLAEGELTIRGRSQRLITPLTLEISSEDGEETARAKGRLRIDRKDYLLGIGLLTLFVDIGREVSVNFELTAHPSR
jgi:polyisoprenoid-binding protein YceI